MSATSAFIGTTDYRPDLFFAELISGRSDFSAGLICPRLDFPLSSFLRGLNFSFPDFRIPGHSFARTGVRA